MKRGGSTLLIVLALTLAVGAKDKPTFNLTAHLLSAGRARAHHNSSLGTGTSWTELNELRIGNLIYAADGNCKSATVGQDYPASLEGKKLRISVGDKVCKYHVTAVREDQ